MSNWPDWREISDDTILNAFTGSLPADPTGARYDRILQYRSTRAVGELTRAVRAAGQAAAIGADNLKAGAGNLVDRLDGLVGTVDSASSRLEEKADKVSSGLSGLADTFHWAAERFHAVAVDWSERYDAFARSQARQQRIVILLTVVIALSTAAYTAITAWSVLVAREGNNLQHQSIEIQRRLLDLQERAAAQNPAPSLPPRN